MSNFFQLVLSGVALGMIYALLAFGYNITFSTSRTINFAQGDFLMLGGLVGLTLFTGLKLPYGVALLGALVLGGLLGIVLEQVAIRPALRTGSTVSWILATVALGIVARNGAERIWGTDDVPFRAPMGNQPFIVGGVRVPPQELLIIGAAVVIMAAFEIFRRRSILGKAVTAVAADRDAASLMGIPVARVITLSFVISSAIAAVAGVLVGPEVRLVGPGMGLLLGTKAYAAAIIGGLTSGLGVVAGGLILGLSEQFAATYLPKLSGGYLSTGYKDIPGFLLLILILLVRPAGLFGKRTIRKV